MSKSINEVNLLGNVGKEIDIVFTPQGMCIANFSVATTYKKKDKTEETEWHRLVAYDKTAEHIREWVHSGNKIHVKGSLRTRKWQDQQGNDRWTTEVIVGSFILLEKKQEGRSPNQRPEAPQQQSAPPPQQQQAQSFDDFDDDLPF